MSDPIDPQTEPPAEDPRFAALRAFAAMDEVAAVRAALDALMPDFIADDGIWPHLSAIRSGLTNLSRAVPSAAPSAPEGPMPFSPEA